jgi:hypothetical protein
VNLAELRDAVHQRTGIAVDPGALTVMVNQAANAIAAEADWPWLHAADTFDTVAGQSVYPVPADWTRTRSIVVGGRTLAHANIRDLESDSIPRTSQYVWTVEGDELHLRPTPARPAAVLHRYVTSERALLVDGDRPRLPVMFHPAIVAYTAYLVFVRADDRRAEAMLEDCGRWLKRMRDDVRRKTGPFRVRVRPGYEGP